MYELSIFKNDTRLMNVVKCLFWGFNGPRVRYRSTTSGEF